MKVLVVEDEHKIANSIKKGLELENFVADVAFDGTEGFDMAASGDYDVIILDLMLPGMDGVEICKELRSEGVHTPILMLTAKSQIVDKVKGLNAGADDYLAKPFAFEELLARVKALNRRPKKLDGKILSAGEIVLDTQKQTVTSEGKEMLLSVKEFSLLEYFLRHPNQVISKDRLIASVWNYDTDILPNTVEVFVASLRKKLGREVIKTVRGFGYKVTSGSSRA
ncbi:DNA-binding response regulator [Candidatus Woesebacteria bacterium RIFOXYA1_FULL_43_9]|uniref:DNA-binding response regulator n=1 Tax=Candidatus Woesebacteria bacterium RIFOXYA1_FULL_43_9 TaxID=1802534 RepID=A0A1F8CM25_9BACT|nr:MAG: DNA-binding response regulator [Candidatus Woesebacteria bacterium RIFOXYA1_FULL_43_9]